LAAVAALVPAEVLTAHAAILTFTTMSVNAHDASQGTKITSPTVLAWSFWGLMVVAVLLYVYPTFKAWDWKRDLVRMWIPPLAFVAWTMLQKTTAFDAVWPGLSTPLETRRRCSGPFFSELLRPHSPTRRHRR
jgi:hypothetical protein